LPDRPIVCNLCQIRRVVTDVTSSPASTGSRSDWLLFLVLGFVWGSSYLFIKIGVEAGLQPFTLIMLRLLIGFAFLVTVAIATRQTLPRTTRPYLHLAVMGFVNILLPFSLITWAEGTVDSSLAAILNAPVPLFVVIIAAVVLKDERLTAAKLAGVAVGLLGVAFVVGFDPATLGRGDLPAELALIGSAISYAVGAVYARRFVRGLPPMIPAVFQVAFALLMVTVLAFVFEQPLAGPVNATTIGAIIWLGLLGSGLAYLLFFRLLSRWGASRTSLVAYLLPVWGIALGFIVLGEPIDASLIVGTALVIVGIALVNRDSTVALLRSAGIRLRLVSPATE
jgi:drug/metabolite transporter (DMT)-like permease